MEELKKFEVITNGTNGKIIYIKSDKKTEYREYDDNGNICCKTIIENSSPSLTYLHRYIFNPEDTRDVTAYYSANASQEEEEKYNKFISRYSSAHEVYKKYENAAECTIFYDNANTDEAINMYKHKGMNFISISVHFTNKAQFKDILANFVYPIDEMYYPSSDIPKMNRIRIDKAVLSSVIIHEKNNENIIEEEYIRSNSEKDITMAELLMSDSLNSLKDIKDLIESNSNNIFGNKLIIENDTLLIKKLGLNETRMTNSNDKYQYSYTFYNPINGKIIKTITSHKTSEESRNGYIKSFYEELTVML